MARGLAGAPQLSPMMPRDCSTMQALQACIVLMEHKSLVSKYAEAAPKNSRFSPQKTYLYVYIHIYIYPKKTYGDGLKKNLDR